jgi:hypothetical protein
LSYFTAKNAQNPKTKSCYLCASDTRSDKLRVLSCPTSDTKSGHLLEPVISSNNSDPMMMFHNVYDMKLEMTVDLPSPKKTQFTILKNFIISVESETNLIHVFDFHNNLNYEHEISSRNKKIDRILAFDDSPRTLVLVLVSNDNELTLLKSSQANHNATFKLNDIQIKKSDLKKNLLSYDLILKQNLIDQTNEQNYQLSLKDMLYREQIKQINYDSKMSLSLLRQIENETKVSNDQLSKENQTKLLLFKNQCDRNLNELKERFESKLYELYLEYDRNFLILNEKTKINEELNRKIEDLTRLNQCEKASLKSKDFFEESNSDQLDFMANLIAKLKLDNKNCELLSDDLTFNLRKFCETHSSNLSKSLKSLNQNRCLLNQALSEFKTNLLKFKHAQDRKYFDESLIQNLRKKCSILNDSCDMMQNELIVRKENDCIKLDELKSSLKTKNEELKRKKSLYETELSLIQFKCDDLDTNCEKLKFEIYKNEELLANLISRKKMFLNLINKK